MDHGFKVMHNYALDADSLESNANISRLQFIMGCYNETGIFSILFLLLYQKISKS